VPVSRNATVCFSDLHVCSAKARQTCSIRREEASGVCDARCTTPGCAPTATCVLPAAQGPTNSVSSPVNTPPGSHDGGTCHNTRAFRGPARRCAKQVAGESACRTAGQRRHLSEAHRGPHFLCQAGHSFPSRPGTPHWHAGDRPVRVSEECRMMSAECGQGQARTGASPSAGP
jgi:hypothetical protein